MRIVLTAVALGALIAGVATAQQQGATPPPPGGPGGPPPMMIMQPLKRADVPAMVAKHFAMMDMNKDGVIDDKDREAMRARRRADMVAEMKAHRDRMFADLDANKDDSISKAEFDAGPTPPPPRGPGPDRMGGPGRGPGPDGPVGPHMRGGPGRGMISGRLIRQADANDDGKVTLAEAQKAALAAFDKADVNHDGTLDRDEMRVAMMTMRGMRGHHGDPDGGRDDGPKGDRKGQ